MMKVRVNMEFIKTFDREVAKMVGVGTSSQPPRYWYSTGNNVLNRIISGSFFKGIPQGRITNLAGSSGSGKSFLAANLVVAAQQAGAFCLVVDSENALDDEFMTKIGVDVDRSGYRYADVATIPQVIDVVSSFLKGYKKEFGEDVDAPEIFILIDSLDMLMTETELEHYGKGEAKGDQGQRNKQLKAMLRSFVQDIKKINVAMVVTSQVYKNQDVKNGEGVWIVSDAVKYAASQIVLLSKLKMKDDSGKVQSYAGIIMKCEGYKTRFTQPFQNIRIEVPYATGMNPYSGLADAAVALDVCKRTGGWYSVVGSDNKWYEKNIADVAEDILVKCETKGDKRLESFNENDFEIIVVDEDEATMQQKRQEKAEKMLKV